ncbi:uncharacterized protein LOC135844943 [Planococcus citri]|uniref:uncharacterized protein LOC135844943 n=1 Tax=Planococcus citri TaxID=170843 RepID=UPI0031F884DB
MLSKLSLKFLNHQKCQHLLATCTRNFTGMYDFNYAEVVRDAKVVDFRSDTFSLPNEGMRRAIYNAEVGDEVYSEDPTVQVLEQRCSKLTGKEAACFVPSGTMGNLISILVHCDKRSSEIIAGSLSHINLFEQTGAAQFGGVNIREVPNNNDGTFDIEELKSRIRTYDIHEPITKLICVENTHNILGGKTLPLDWIDEIGEFGKSRKIPLHMDGARIFNAAINCNVPISRLVQDFDTITFCFSKGLGAPYGAMIHGTTKFIDQAKRVRKALGGSARQTGFMAAAALYALDNLAHLRDDHENVHKIANAIREANNPYVTVPPRTDIHSNILLVYVNPAKLTADDLAHRLREVSPMDDYPIVIKTLPLTPDKLRITLCCNNSDSDVEDAIMKIKTVINEYK